MWGWDNRAEISGQDYEEEDEFLDVGAAEKLLPSQLSELPISRIKSVSLLPFGPSPAALAQWLVLVHRNRPIDSQHPNGTEMKHIASSVICHHADLQTAEAKQKESQKYSPDGEQELHEKYLALLR